VPDVLKSHNISFTWGRKVQVKDRILEILQQDLRSNPRGVVGVSTITDPYQPAERFLGVTRDALSILLNSKFPVSVQTKSSLVVRDLDIIKSNLFEVGITITSLEEEFYRHFEPGASPPEQRIQALEEVSSKGIPTWIFYGPIIPSFNDSSKDIEDIIYVAKKTKSRIIYDRLNIRPFISERMRKILTAEEFNNIKHHNFDEIFKRIENICKKQGIPCEFAF